MNSTIDTVYSPHSLLMTLRCQVHLELAKCEEDQEQISVAMTHLKKVSINLSPVFEASGNLSLHFVSWVADILSCSKSVIYPVFRNC